jgi:hypothetical protein
MNIHTFISMAAVVLLSMSFLPQTSAQVEAQTSAQTHKQTPDDAAVWAEAAVNFRETPLKVRPNPLWFWNNTRVEPAELTRQIADYKKAGYGGLSILPFGKDFKPEYLTEDYFEVYRLCVEEAEKQGLTLWLYDEYGFPSGTAGDINGDGVGRFRRKYPQHAMKRLDKTEYVCKQGVMLDVAVPSFDFVVNDGAYSPQLMAAVALDTVTHKRLNLSKFIKDGRLRWSPPAGNWKTLLFTCVDAGRTIVDYMSPEAVNLYIGMTHDEYYRRFGEAFGNTITGTFFDEPTLYYADGRPWTPDFNRQFRKKYGFSPDLLYPALWYDIGETTAEARNYLFAMRSELYAVGYPKLTTDWSLRHGVRATGHQDNEEIVNCVGTSGDFMKCFKYQDIPGIDKIGGARPAEKFYKLVSSAATIWRHPLVMSETYGAMGNISWAQIFGIAMDQYVKGINLLIPHAVWYNTQKVTFLPELSLRNPLYADSLNAMTDYLARLNSLMQNDGLWQGDVAVLYPIHALQSGHYFDGPLDPYRGGVIIEGQNYVEVGVELSDRLGCDFLFLHPETLDEQCVVKNGTLRLNGNITFSTIILPASATVSLSNIQKISRFAKQGGKVIIVGDKPSQATRVADNSKVAAAVAQLSASKNVFAIATPAELKDVLQQTAQSLTFKSAATLRNIHKVYAGKSLWFFANPEAESKTAEIELAGEYSTLELWDPHTGKTAVPLAATVGEGKTHFNITLAPCRSIFVIEK